MANREGGSLEKPKDCLQSTARKSSCSSTGTRCPQALPEQRVLRIPLVLGSSQLSSPRRGLGPSSAPHVAHPRSQPANGLARRQPPPPQAETAAPAAGGPAPEPKQWLLLAVGGRRGAPDHQLRLRPGAASRGKPGRAGAAERPLSAGRRGPGGACLTRVSTCCPDPPRVPLTYPRPLGLGPHPGRSLLCGLCAPPEHQNGELLLLVLMIQHHSCPRGLGSVGEGRG